VRNSNKRLSLLFGLTSCVLTVICAQKISNPIINLTPVDSGWANNSINAVVFRKNSLVTWKDTQFIAFYNKAGEVVVGKRQTGSGQWALHRTHYTGNAADAHNSISIMVDGEGFLHMAWDHHNTPLRYCKGIAPLSLDLSEPLVMTGRDEQRVTYPEFYKMKNGNLLFLYRSGESGNGQLILKEYSTATKMWSPLQNNLIDGEGKRSAYWQAAIDQQGTIHLSWVWRESPDVASNHDLCYARSIDNGKTWEKSTGEKYLLPITASSAEYAWRIPPNSELINQTSMSADEKGNPFIATYWREINHTVPQYRLVYYSGTAWQHLELKFRTTAFSLSGVGTKRIPISRPQLLIAGAGSNASAILIFRDEERQQKASAVIIRKIKDKAWHLMDLTETSVGSWEPTYDTELWRGKKIINLYLQFVEQADAEGLKKSVPGLIHVLEWKNPLK
jgi:hypothetical protein